MFKTIYIYELKHWIKQPAVYIYAIFILVLAILTMSGMAAEDSNRFGGRVINSSVFLLEMTRKFMLLLFLILPAVFGLSIYRDFNTQMHSILYAYPFSKRAYLAAKYLSAFTIFMGITAMLGLGYIVGAELIPGANPELLQSFNPAAYLQLYGLFIFPNIVLLSGIVFSVVLLSRNVYAGFVTALVLMVIQQIAGSELVGGHGSYIAGLLDPLGLKSFGYYTSHWTVDERNSKLLPFEGVVIWNRLLWFVISFVIFFLTYRKFNFHQGALTFFNRQNIQAQKTAQHFGMIHKIVLPKANFDFSLLHNLRGTWQLAKTDFRSIVMSRSFFCLVLAGLVFVIVVMSTVDPRLGTETLPMTWQLLELPIIVYAGVINVITFLYAGLLVHRGKLANMHQLIDTTPVENWMLLGSKLLALIKMQMVLLSLVMLGGIFTQITKGYYNFELGQYVFNLFGINLIHFVIWAMLALFIQTVIDNPYIGFFLLLFAPIGFIGISEFGPQHLGLDFLEQMMFRYNQAPGDVFGLKYSDLDGYGAMLPSYFIYKLYWALAGLLLLVITLMLWKRGLPQSFAERLRIGKQRFSGKLAAGFMVICFAFISLGAGLFYESNVAHQYFTRGQKIELLTAAEQKYKRYEDYVQPKIVSVKMNMDIFPEERQFRSDGQYWLVNKSEQKIDTLIINYLTGTNASYDFNRMTNVVSKDTVANFSHFDILELTESLMPGDSMQMTFTNHNDPKTLLRTNDFVKSQGAIIKDNIFPRFGNYLEFVRSSNNLGGRSNAPKPSDDHSHHHSYMGMDADHVDFEAIVSTSSAQIAIAPGALKKQWVENNRNYFQYETQKKICMSYLFLSGNYAVESDKWHDIDLEIYYDKDHAYNIRRMMNGLKAGLDYCTEHFSPYQFKQVRIVEFAQINGRTAHGYPSVIPTGEGAGFIADVDESPEGGNDFAFGTAVHEVAHMWWGHQVMPSETRGAKLVVESTAVYVSMKVEELINGIDKANALRKGGLESYLKERTRQRREESPLMYAYPDENYLAYQKGGSVLYAMSDYLGENVLNNALKTYVEAVAYQEGTYTTSEEMVDYIRLATPDTLQYLIHDMFETVTLYDNKMHDWTTTALADGSYQVDLSFQVSKYRSGKNGKAMYSDNQIDSLSYHSPENDMAIHSLPLADYIEVGIFDEHEDEILIQKIEVTNIQNTLTFVVDKKPWTVGVDPYFKLIDRSLSDNIMRFTE